MTLRRIVVSSIRSSVIDLSETLRKPRVSIPRSVTQWTQGLSVYTLDTYPFYPKFYTRM